MPTTRNLLLAVLMAAAAADASAQTQPPPASLGFVNLNFGTQPSSREVGKSESFSLYGETATLTTAQVNGNGAVFDITAGYRFRPNLAAAIGFSNFSNTSDSAVAVSIPDPLIFDRPRAVSSTVSDLEHSERGIHLQAVWFVPVTDKVDISLSAGPSFIRVKQQLVSSVTVPPGTQTANLNVATEEKTAIGANIGIDGNYMFTRNVGAGVFVRYAGAKAELPSAPDLRVGGVQAGAGVRVRF